VVKKTGPLHYVTRYYNKQNVQPFSVKMLTEEMLHPLLQQMFEVASLCVDTSPEMLSPFISYIIINVRPDCTLLQLSNISKIIPSGLLSFSCKFFHQSVYSKSFKLVHI